MRVFKAPESTANTGWRTLFLAGSIEMGKAEMWQDKAVCLLEEAAEKLKKEGIRYSSEYSIINPRRDDWDSSWVQDYDNPQFNQQVTWELHNIKKATTVLFYFDPLTKSPITLMELGYIAGINPRRAVVVCPDGFWRKGNVDVLCHLNGINQFSTLEDAINDILLGAFNNLKS